MSDSTIIQEHDPDTYTVTTGDQETCFSGAESAADQIACLHSIVEGLREDVACYEAMKQGVSVRIADLEVEVKRLRAAVLSMRSLWPVERWATLSAICRDHPCIDREAAKAGGE